MNLIIDVGNSFVKLAVFKADNLKFKESIENETILAYLDLLKKEYPLIDKAIISSVGKLKKSQIKIISKSFNLVILDSSIKLPFKNGYKTPETLGVDRLALVCASVNQFPEQMHLL